MLVDRPSRRARGAVTAVARRVSAQLLRRLADRNGLSLVPAGVPSADVRRTRMLRADAITVVLDVGANEGQYARSLRHHGWTGRIVSFEPQAAPFEVLAANCEADADWQSRRLALAAEPGAGELNVSLSSMSSSFLPMHANHERLVPGSQYVGAERVSCLPLDEVFDEHVGPDDRAALKIDVQGFEAQVLAGASRSLSRIQLVELELCLIELYVGQPAADEIIATLAAAGFGLVGVDSEHVDPATGRTSWANATFRRA